MTLPPFDVPHAAETPGRSIRELIERRAEALAAAAERVRGRSDEEAIHDLRVASRRLSAALSLWRDLLRERPRRRASRRLRRLRRAIGRARELEVHVADLREFALAQSPLARLALAELAARLAAAMDRGRRRAARRAEVPRMRRIARGVTRAASAIEARAVRLDDALAGARTRVAAAASAGRLALEHALAGGDDTALHAARIAVKKWRYALEAIAAAAPADTPRLERLRGIQTALGTVHDRATLRDRIVRHVDELNARGYGRAAETLRAIVAEVEAQRLAAVSAFREAMRPTGAESAPAAEAPVAVEHAPAAPEPGAEIR